MAKTVSPSRTADSSEAARIRSWSEPEHLVQVADAIAQQICEHRAHTPDGTVTWLGPKGYGTPRHPLRVKKLGPHLYNGTTGVALFLAAMERIRGDGQYREVCLRALAPLRSALADLARDPGRGRDVNVAIGGLIGLGSFIYGFLKIGELLDEPALIHEAHKVTNLLTPERIAADERVRLQTGSAGTILALLALHRRIADPNDNRSSPLELALFCADNLIAKRISFDGRPRAWPLSPGKPPMIGFSYGAAGACYALLRLYEVTHEPEIWNTAQEGLAFLQSLYSPAHKAWRDTRALFEAQFEGPIHGSWKEWWASGGPLRPRNGSRARARVRDLFLDLWCHGGAGIVLGRLGALHVVGGPEVHEEIRGALEVTSSYSQPEVFQGGTVDDVCCGHMGRVEVLSYASRKLDSEELLTAAQTLAYRVWRRAQVKGRYEVSAARASDAFSPSLFQGIAGIGYTLLRLASRPSGLSCLLLLE